MVFEEFENDDWMDIKDSSSKELTHDIHPYFAKFSPEIPRNLIQKFSDKRDRVLDPFSGSGTTLIEGLSLGRNVVGVDANPLACLIAKVKTTKLREGDRGTVNEVIESASTQVNQLHGQQTFGSQTFEEPEIPDFHNRDKWFNEKVQRELAVIKQQIESVENERAYDLLRIAFSRIIVGVSNQESESRYTAVENDISDGECVRRFEKRAKEILEKVERLNSAIPESVEGEIHNQDAREMNGVDDESIDFVVTSPPYLNSWDYGLYHKFRFIWLGMDVDQFNGREIGRHLRRNEDKIERYSRDMDAVLQRISEKLVPGGRCVIVNATSVVDGEHIDTNKILADVAEPHNLTLEDSVSKDVYGPHFGLRASNGGGKQKEEKILAFRK